MNSPVDELKPCPFCKGTGSVERQTGKADSSGGVSRYADSCPKCQGVGKCKDTRAESPDGVAECKKCGDYGYIYHGPTVIAGEIGESSELCDCPAGKNLLSPPPPAAEGELIVEAKELLRSIENEEQYMTSDLCGMIEKLCDALQSRSTPPPVALEWSQKVYGTITRYLRLMNLVVELPDSATGRQIEEVHKELSGLLLETPYPEPTPPVAGGELIQKAQRMIASHKSLDLTASPNINQFVALSEELLAALQSSAKPDGGELAEAKEGWPRTQELLERLKANNHDCVLSMSERHELEEDVYRLYGLIQSSRDGVVIPEHLAESVLVELKDTLEAVGGCDHSVGICCCQLIRTIEEYEQALEDSRNG